VKINKLKFYLRFIGVLVFGFILYKIDFKKLWQVIIHVQLIYIIISVILLILLYVVKSYRWKLLLNSQKIYYSFKNTFLAFTASNFIAFITPGRVGEFSKTIYLKNDIGVAYSRSFASVLTDRLFDVYILLLSGIYGIINLGLGYNTYLLVFLAISLLLPLLLFNKRACEAVVRFIINLPVISRFLKNKIGNINSLSNSFQELLHKNLIYALLLTLISYFILYITSFFIAYSVHLDLTVNDIILLVSIGNIISFIPISISGLGTREAFFIYYLKLQYYSIEQALLLSTLFFIVFYILGGLIAYICFMIKPLNIKILNS
jgi:uncharacterized protein (TIRG00374 family)